MSFSKLKDYMDELVTIYNTPSVDCIVYKGHEQIFRYFTGMRDVENNKMMQGNELYLIFSMTKMITCTCALQLFEKGLYHLEDPVYFYLPEFEKMKISVNGEYIDDGLKVSTGNIVNISGASPADGYAQNPITIKDLFTMSAGLDYVLDDEPIRTALKEGKKTTRELVAAMANKVLLFEPGSRYKYSLCHDVLGALVEVLSGKSLGEYMKKEIFEPLGMKSTYFGIPRNEKDMDKVSSLYRFINNGKREKVPLSCPFNLSEQYESGGAGLTSCIEDYALFLDAMANFGVGKSGEKILSAPTIELMRANHLTGKRCDDFDKMRAGYGYGLGVRTHVDNVRSGSISPLGEFGWDGAAGGFALVDTKNQLSLTYFQHIYNWDLRIHSKMRNILYSCLD